MKQVFRMMLVMVLMVPVLGRAHEGMWLVSMLNRIQEAEMKNLGLNLTTQEIYDINNASLKDAIVRLNGGQCTGEVVSSKGLIFTNHHCAYDAIQSLSTVENDILTNGFCAKSMKEERPIPGFEISFLVRIEDVTKEVLAGVLNGMTEVDRNLAIRTKLREIEGRATDGNSYEAEVKSFYYGNEYYLFVYNTYRDVRLVGNPAESIGKFGGDTDNWMWPRHTGDFSMLRIYADADNNPADYSENNKPYTPKHFLKMNTLGIEEGDFAMIMGYPGTTDRYLTSWGVKQAMELSNPSTIAIRDLKLKTMKKHMDADPAVRLKYASKYASTANYWKYFIGQNKGLARLDVYGKKQREEQDFVRWVNTGDAARKEKYGKALGMLEEYYKATDAGAVPTVYALEAGLIGAELPLFAFRFSRVYESAMLEMDLTKRAEILNSFKPQAEEFYRDFDLALEKDVFIQLASMYRKNLPADQRPSWMAEIDKKYKGSVEAYANKLYATSMFRSKETLMTFLAKPSQKVYDKDMAVVVAKSAIETYRTTLGNPAQQKFDEGYRLYVAGLREMNPGKSYSPDANSTMRLTYGTVKDYKAADAVSYDFYTTTKGILEKRDNTNPEFVVADKQKELIERKDFGKYANKEGELVVCFIGDLDITGGNSGSPVIDGNGNLIGIAFDGNWEAMSGDIAYEPELQRTIAVDVRYVLWVIEKLMDGRNIIGELEFTNQSAPSAPLAKPEASEVLEPSPAPAPAPTPAPTARPDAKPTAKPAEKRPAAAVKK